MHGSLPNALIFVLGRWCASNELVGPEIFHIPKQEGIKWVKLALKFNGSQTNRQAQPPRGKSRLCRDIHITPHYAKLRCSPPLGRRNRWRVLADSQNGRYVVRPGRFAKP